MSSVLQYCYRSLKNVTLIAASVGAVASVCAVVDWLLPINIHNGLVVAALHLDKQIGICALFLVALFFAYKAHSIYKTEKSFWRELLKMTPAIVFWFTLLLLITGFFVDNQYYNCQKYNYSSKLNGGIKTFDGKKYTIGICGSGINNSHFLGDSMEAVELTVTDDQGALLAKRHYKVFWDGRPGHEPLTTGPHSIIYQDDDKQEDHSIAMPPSLLDRVRARLF